MKKILSAILALCMVMSLSVQLASATEKRTLPSDEVIQKTAATFPDAANNWALKYISYCTENGIFNGTSANTFNPNGNVTRAQFVVILARLYGAGKYDVKENIYKFSDVMGDEWFVNPLDWFTNFYDFSKEGDGQFHATQIITRGEVANALYNYAYAQNNHSAPTITKHTDYADKNSMSDFMIKVADYLAEQGIMAGGSDNKFNPNGSLTRAQMAAILFRMPIYG